MPLHRQKKEVVLADGIYLFATPTCPNCRMAKSFLAQANISFVEVMATENPELVKSLNIKQAPTLVVVSEGEIHTIENVSNIRRYIETDLTKKG